MILNITYNTYQAVRSILAKRHRYAQMAHEIESLSERDLADIRGDRAEMLHQAHEMVYGKR